MEAPAALRINGLTGDAAPYKGVYGQRDKDEHGYWQYQNEIDPSRWLCYVAAAGRGSWLLQHESDRGTTTGVAHTASGDHSAPWDRAARWREWDVKEWHDAPDVAVTVYASAAAATKEAPRTDPSTPCREACRHT